MIALIILLPLILATALIVFIFDGWPVFFIQKRLGYRGREFNIYKFRTMGLNAEKNGPILTKSFDDPRFTRVGRFLSRYYLNEIPQFLNVLTGKMSFIGPRPERPYFHKLLSKKIHGWPKRLSVPQGIIGLAQIHSATSLEPEKKLGYDLKYIDNISLVQDVKIILEAMCLRKRISRTALKQIPDD